MAKNPTTDVPPPGRNNIELLIPKDETHSLLLILNTQGNIINKFNIEHIHTDNLPLILRVTTEQKKIEDYCFYSTTLKSFDKITAHELLHMIGYLGDHIECTGTTIDIPIILE